MMFDHCYPKYSVLGSRSSLYTKTRRGLACVFALSLTTQLSAATAISEDFSSGASNFSVVSGGTWSVSNGRYLLSGPASGVTPGVLENISVHGTSLSGDFTLDATMNITGTGSAWNDAVVIFGYQDANNYYYVSLNESNDGDTKGIFKVVSGSPTQLADITTSVASDADYSIEVARSGTSITVSVDTSQVASASDSTFSGGQVGFGSYNDGAEFDDLVVTVDSGVSELFSDDFNDGDANGWTTSGGSWSVNSNEYFNTGSGWSLAGSTSWDDYVIKADVQAILSTYPGVYGRVQGTSNSYHLEINVGNQDVELWKRAGGSWTQLDTHNTTISLNTWYELKLEMDGSSLTGYLDGVAVVSATDTTHTSGQIGLRSGNDARFDNVLVTELGGSGDITAPSVPTGLTSSNVTTTSVDLDWNASTDDVGVAGYNIYIDSSFSESVISTSVSVVGLTPNTSYTFSVSAYDAASNESSQSGGENVTTTMEQVAGPQFSPAGGTYSSAQSVAISTATSGASIRYTTDGSTPTSTTGTLYSGAVSISSSSTLKAIAYKSGMLDSTVTTEAYTIATQQEVIVDNDQTETDGTWTTSVYKPNRYGANYAYSDSGTGSDKIRWRPNLVAGAYDVSIWLPDGDSSRASNAPFTVYYDGGSQTYLVDETGAGGSWTYLGTHDFASGTSGYVELTDDANSSYVIADAVQFLPSSGGSSQVVDPQFNPVDGTYSSAQSVAITTSTGGAAIRYTIDGSTPTSTSGTIYSSPVSISSTTTLKAIAYATGMTDSNVTTATYTIDIGTVAAPQFSPGGGAYSSAQSVTITSSTSGSTIRYTTDGSTPTSTTGTVYASPVSISSSATLKAIAYMSGMADSSVSTAVYTITTGAPLYGARGAWPSATPAENATPTATFSNLPDLLVALRTANPGDVYHLTSFNLTSSYQFKDNTARDHMAAFGPNDLNVLVRPAPGATVDLQANLEVFVPNVTWAYFKLNAFFAFRIWSDHSRLARAQMGPNATLNVSSSIEHEFVECLKPVRGQDGDTMQVSGSALPTPRDILWDSCWLEGNTVVSEGQHSDTIQWLCSDGTMTFRNCYIGPAGNNATFQFNLTFQPSGVDYALFDLDTCFMGGAEVYGNGNLLGSFDTPAVIRNVEYPHLKSRGDPFVLPAVVENCRIQASDITIHSDLGGGLMSTLYPNNEYGATIVWPTFVEPVWWD